MKEQLKTLHQKARLQRDATGSQAYGAALAAIQEGEVRANEDFDEAKAIAVIEKEAGKFRESAEAFAKAGRGEKAEELQSCCDLLEALLPEKLDAESYPQIVSEAIESTGASSMRDMGAVMAVLKKTHGAALDMRQASSVVKEILG